MADTDIIDAVTKAIAGREAEPLAQLCLSLAKELVYGGDVNVAAIARELRMALKDLRDADGAALDGLVDDLSS